MFRARGAIPAPLTMLIVDRSPMLRAMLKRVLQISGVPIAAILDAADRTQALDQLTHVPIDALFVGVDPPEREGADLLRTVLLHGEWRHVVCIAMGAHPAAALASQEPLPLRGTLEMPFTTNRVRELLSDLILSTPDPRSSTPDPRL